MKKTTIAVDMDDVLADAYGRIIEIYESENGLKIDKEAIKGKKYTEAFTGEQLAIVKQIPHTENFFHDLNVIENSQEIMAELYNRHDVYIVSAAMEYPFSLKAKKDWLEQHFPFIHWKKIIFCGDKSIIGTDYLIDDHVFNLETFKGIPLIFSCLHNLDETKFERMHNWLDVESKFL
ncbi:MAG: 5'(3')-deoxyribonucleotidase [Bacteroidetes bacterium]|nr:5'(3')-deoxyribonucleotidase [Bacteroidota bacterium]MDA1119948.1 5'(3')-deoxyribonucleotidase [Bacteroidota bacterium]